MTATIVAIACVSLTVALGGGMVWLARRDGEQNDW